MAYVINTPIAGAQPIADRDTTKRHPLGTIVRATDDTLGSGEFIYLAGAASTAIYDWGTYNRDDHTFTRLAANAIGPVAIAMAATTASYYGWFAISGKVYGNALTLYADNAKVWITGTAGSVDDTSVAGDLVVNAKGAGAKAVGTAYAEFEIDRPWVNDRQSGS